MIVIQLLAIPFIIIGFVIYLIGSFFYVMAIALWCNAFHSQHWVPEGTNLRCPICNDLQGRY